MITERMTMKFVVYICLFILFDLQILYAGPAGQNENQDKRAGEVKLLIRFMAQSGATEDETSRMARMMEEKKISAETVQAIRKTLVNADREGLPINPFIHKAYEGMAKNVTETALASALEKTRIRYAFAFQKSKGFGLNKKDTTRLTSTIADCMSASVSEKHMEQILEQIRERVQEKDKNTVRIADQSLVFGRTMARMGVPSETVRDLVCLALNKDYTADDFNELQKNFIRHARVGSASQVAEDYTVAISRGARASDMNDMTGKGYSWGRSGSGDAGTSSSGSASPGGSGYSGGSGNGSYGSGTSGSNGAGNSGGRRGGRGGRN